MGLFDDDHHAVRRSLVRIEFLREVICLIGVILAYGRMIEVQARMLAAHVRGDIPRYTGFTVR